MFPTAPPKRKHPVPMSAELVSFMTSYRKPCVEVDLGKRQTQHFVLLADRMTKRVMAGYNSRGFRGEGDHATVDRMLEGDLY